jgi:flagellar protein FliO/FliZ
MIDCPFPFSRTRVRAVLLVLCAWALAPAASAQAFTPAKGGGEDVPLNVPKPAAGHAAASASSGGPSIVRTIVGLVIVLAVIWGLTWVLKQVKSGRESRSVGSGLEAVATLPLGGGRSLHLVRAGNDHLLVGSGEQGVVPVFRYSEEQARAAGLFGEDEELLEHPEHPRAVRARAAGTPGDRDPGRSSIQIPGHNERIIDRLREWTERR